MLHFPCVHIYAALFSLFIRNYKMINEHIGSGDQVMTVNLVKCFGMERAALDMSLTPKGR